MAIHKGDEGLLQARATVLHTAQILQRAGTFDCCSLLAQAAATTGATEALLRSFLHSLVSVLRDELQCGSG